MPSEPGHHLATLTPETGYQRFGHTKPKTTSQTLSEPRSCTAGERGSAASQKLSEPRSCTAGERRPADDLEPALRSLAEPELSRAGLLGSGALRRRPLPGRPRRDRIGGQRPCLCPIRSAGRRVLSPRPPWGRQEASHAAESSFGSGARPGAPGSLPV